ncbi:hypothetical protein B0H13DRAFT_1908678 [Mycena leptocephala]|nr:hypothetical protein B0H13DRAFT_1908678 [Mycena leptocephala]
MRRWVDMIGSAVVPCVGEMRRAGEEQTTLPTRNEGSKEVDIPRCVPHLNVEPSVRGMGAVSIKGRHGGLDGGQLQRYERVQREAGEHGGRAQREKHGDGQIEELQQMVTFLFWLWS